MAIIPIPTTFKLRWKHWLLLVALMTLSTMFISCNTVEGVGEDIQHAGYHIERAAR